ncbi:MAG: hypothetical protein Q9222_005629 [Ikaeria aurantiellina]
MPLRLAPCSPQDLATCSRIQWEASASNPFWQLLFPNGGTAALQNWTTYYLHLGYHNPSVQIAKAVLDTPNHELIIGCAKWTELDIPLGEMEIHNGDYGQQAATNPPHVPDEDSDEDIFNEWMAGVVAIRKRYLNGKPIVVLDDLSVVPQHQRQGAGKLLLHHLVEYADARGLPCYVESTPIACDLYMRHGFRRVDGFEIDLGKWKPENDVYRTSMLYRDARKTCEGETA